MTGDNIAILGIAATLAVAAIAAQFKLIAMMIAFSNAQTEYRHKLRDDLTTIVLRSEDRCMKRIETIEQYSVGLRQARHSGELEGDGN